MSFGLNPELLKIARASVRQAIDAERRLEKSAVVALGGAPPGMAPAAMGGAPPGMDPAAMGGAPPGMDPAAMGGGLDLAAMGLPPATANSGQPAPEPAPEPAPAAAPQEAAPAAPAMTAEDVRRIIQEEMGRPSGDEGAGKSKPKAAKPDFAALQHDMYGMKAMLHAITSALGLPTPAEAVLGPEPEAPAAPEAAAEQKMTPGAVKPIQPIQGAGPSPVEAKAAALRDELESRYLGRPANALELLGLDRKLAELAANKPEPLAARLRRISQGS